MILVVNTIHCSEWWMLETSLNFHRSWYCKNGNSTCREHLYVCILILGKKNWTSKKYVILCCALDIIIGQFYILYVLFITYIFKIKNNENNYSLNIHLTTYSNVLSFHEQLRYSYNIGMHAISNLCLIFHTHEDITFLEFD